MPRVCDKLLLLFGGFYLGFYHMSRNKADKDIRKQRAGKYNKQGYVSYAAHVSHLAGNVHANHDGICIAALHLILKALNAAGFAAAFKRFRRVILRLPVAYFGYMICYGKHRLVIGIINHGEIAHGMQKLLGVDPRIEQILKQFLKKAFLFMGKVGSGLRVVKHLSFLGRDKSAVVGDIIKRF